MAGEHDFAPLSEGDIAKAAAYDVWAANHMAREIRASRAAMREWAEASLREEQARRFWQDYRGDDESEMRRRENVYWEWRRKRQMDEAAIRALVAHVGRGAEHDPTEGVR